MVQTNRGMAHEIRGRGTVWSVGLRLAFVGTVFSSTAMADVLHVPGDFPTIQGCIDAALDGDECVVAPGTYHELINFNGKAITLRSSDGPKVTIIDAEPVPETPEGKSVVRCVSGEGPDTVLDGFTLTGGTGSACFLLSSTCGGGMFNVGASPTVRNCTFSGDWAEFGGGMLNLQNSNPILTNCTFTENSAELFGGGMYNTFSNPSVANCTFVRNSTGAMGGGMFNEHASTTVTNCVFVGNQTSIGNRGGGMSNKSNSNVSVTNCTFAGNSAHLGGGIWNSSSSLYVTNSAFTGNTAGLGAGVYVLANSNALVVNCTFSRNLAEESGGAVYSMPSNFPPPPILGVRNCVMWGNTPNQITNEPGAQTVVWSTDVQGGWPGVGNIDTDPLLADADGPDGIPGTDDDDLRLASRSPCIDAGENAWLPFDVLTDLAGRPRFFNDRRTPDTGGGAAPIVDMGAYEFGSGACVDAAHFSLVLCHQAPEGLGRPKTIRVSMHEAFDHFAHGDTCGACVRLSKSR